MTGSGMFIEPPHINAADTDTRLKQMESYLNQLAQQLNWALTTIEAGTPTAYTNDRHRSDGETSNK